jgi:transposase
MAGNPTTGSSLKAAMVSRVMYRARWTAHSSFCSRRIAPTTLGRRNWTFLGSDSGGDRAAIVFTLIQSCKLNGVNPEAYLADLIGRVGDHPASRLDQLLPWNWTARVA